MTALTPGFRHLRLAAAAALVCALAQVWATEPPATLVGSADAAAQQTAALAAYRALAADQARSYDRIQDISPRQMLILLEISERTGASLGQALATGEYESARTWNDFVRPTLGNGTLGSATGVWQFIPATFHRIIRNFGGRLLAASDADPTTGRDRLDLGAGPFTDAQVRRLIQETVDGSRGIGDEELQLLRHNFTVLAFAKHYLSLESGATTPEEDYLFHFLGEERGREVLALARGPARHTLCVRQPDLDPFPPVSQPELATNAPLAADPLTDPLEVRQRVRLVWQTASSVAAESAARPQATLPLATRIWVRPRLKGELQRDMLDGRLNALPDLVIERGADRGVSEPAIWSTDASTARRAVSSEWGLPADSPVVTGNLGMFYRDGKGQSQPYTWAEFLDTLASRVRAKDQPALVRAKYGVGFELRGGDMPTWRFDPARPLAPTSFHHELLEDVVLPRPLVTGPLNEAETRQFKARLAELVAQGEGRPQANLPPAAIAALRYLGVLSAEVPDVVETEQALQRFRALVGKAAPDDPAQAAMLLPAERVALELYAQRLARYAAWQAAQQAGLDDAIDLKPIPKMPAGPRQWSKTHIAVLQRALADAGLLERPTRQVVWRDRKGKRHQSEEPAPFDGIAGRLTLAALDRFQLRHGLRETQGRLDAVTLALLGLPPMGPEVFRPLSGPSCVAAVDAEAVPMCRLPTQRQPGLHDTLPPRVSDPGLRWFDPPPGERLTPTSPSVPDSSSA